MNSRKISRFFVYFFLTVGALIMLLPFFWMFSSAFKTTQEINRFPPQWLPSHLSLENFKRAFEMAPFGRYFVNSVVVMVVSVSVTTFTTILAAFAFSRLHFPGRNLIFSLLLSLMMIPFEMLIITNYTTVVNLKVYDTLYALILPFTSSIFYTYILKNFFDSVSDSLYWSARIDGSSNWRFLWKVMVPLSLPTLISITILKMMGAWNSYIWPRLVANDDAHRLITNGLRSAFTDTTGDVNYPVQMAAVALVSAPLFLVFVFLRKYIMSGVSRSGIKG